jgi:hypothetical protein
LTSTGSDKPEKGLGYAKPLFYALFLLFLTQIMQTLKNNLFVNRTGRNCDRLFITEPG